MALFKMIFAVDPKNPSRVAANGVISIFAPGTRTLIPLKTGTGENLTNPVSLNSLGFGSEFIADGYTQVAWEATTPGQVFTGTFESYEGLLAQALAAQESALAASTSASAAVQAIQDIIANGGGGGGLSEVRVEDILDASDVGRSVLTAASTSAARSAIGAGTSNLQVGGASTQAKPGNYVPTYGDIPSGSMLAVVKEGTVWPDRYTDRPDVRHIWIGADPGPAIVTSGVKGMRETDARLVG